MPRLPKPKAEPTPDKTEIPMSNDIKVYTAPDGSQVVQTPDGSMHASVEEAQAYMNEHQVEMLVSQFIADASADPTFFANKKGEVPGERAMQAMQTRLSKAATQVLSWYLARG